MTDTVDQNRLLGFRLLKDNGKMREEALARLGDKTGGKVPIIDDDIPPPQ